MPETALNFSELKKSLAAEAQKRLALRPIKDELKDLQLQLASGNVAQDEASQERLKRMESKLMEVSETECHIALMNSFDHSYQEMALEMTERFIEENKCETMQEKMLAEALIGSFIRHLDFSRKLNRAIYDSSGVPSKEENKYIAFLGKQADVAYRQYMAAFMIFNQGRKPPMSLNINTSATVISQTITHENERAT
jgi:hypothetical protein